MNPTLEAFFDELEKISAGKFDAHDAIELAGLATLSAPHAYNALTGKNLDHKVERNAELAGLGILAAPYVYKGIQTLRGRH